MSFFRTVLNRISATDDDRALARDIAVYPVAASSASVVLPRGTAVYLDAPHAAELREATEAVRPVLPHVRVRLG